MGIIVFISYSRRDNDIFQIPKLAEELENYDEIDEALYYEGVDYNNIVKYMNDNIGRCQIFLSFCSQNASKSEYIEMEWQAALFEKKKIIPVFLDYKDVPPLLKPYLGIQFEKNELETKVEEIYLVILKALGLLEAFKDNCINLINLGKDSIKSAHYEEAINFLQQARKLCDEKPLDPALLNEIDGLIKEIKDLKEEEVRLNKEREVKLRNESKELWNRAMQEFDSKHWEKSISLFQQAKNLFSKLNDSKSIIQTDKVLLKAKESKKREEEEKEIKQREEKLRRESKELWKQAMQEFDSKHWEESISLFQQARSLFSKLSDLKAITQTDKVLLKAKESKKREEEEKAKKVREEALRNEGEKTLNIFQHKLDAGQWEEAIILLQRARKIYAQLNDKEKINYIEEFLVKVKKSKQKEDLERDKKQKGELLRKDGNNFFNLAQENFKKQKWDSAIKHFKQAIEIYSQLNDFENIAKSEKMLIKCSQQWKPSLKNILQERIHASIAELSSKINMSSEIILPFLESIAYRDGDDFWIDKEEFIEAQKPISFRGAKVNQYEVQFLKKLEQQLDKEFSLINNYTSKNKMGFQVKNKRISELALYNCKLSTLSESIGELKSLETLFLRKNQLNSLPESIGNLMSLKWLSLADNQIFTFPESFWNLKSLQTLSLTGNKISNLSESIGNLESLKTLFLADNQIIILPESFWNLKSLQLLSLAGNKISDLSESLGNLQLLTELSLTGNKLSRLPESLISLKSLQKLNLASTQLSVLPDWIENLRSLIELSLSKNTLSSLPESFWNLKSLKKLDLSSNQIEILPESLGNLKSIQILDLNDNQLINIPETISNLKSLQLLNVHNNKLKNLPESIGALTSLEKLYCNYNQLKEIPKSIGNLKKLKEIWMSGNNIKKIPISIEELIELQKLTLNNNKIRKIPKSLETLISQNIIELRGNPLDSKVKTILDKIRGIGFDREEHEEKLKKIIDKLEFDALE